MLGTPVCRIEDLAGQHTHWRGLRAWGKSNGSVASGGGELFSAISHLVVDQRIGIAYNYLMTKTHKTTPLDILRAIRANSRRWSSGEQTYEQFGAEGIRLWALAKTLGMVDAVSDLMHSDIAEAC